MTISRFAGLLETTAGRPVQDQTGLAGEFDVDLSWSQELSVFTALREQLGLKLEGGTRPRKTDAHGSSGGATQSVA